MGSRRGWIPIVGLAVALAFPGGASGAVLYDQTNFAGTNEIESDDFNGTAQDDQAADDFTVPPGQRWKLSGVDVLGSFGGTPPPTVNAFLYENAAYVPLPGAELFRQLNILSGGGPNYQVALTGAPELKAGAYWISIQQAGATFMIPAWYWKERTVQAGAPAAFRRPFAPPGPCAPDWGTRTTCNSSSEPDQLFRLNGTAVSDPVTFGKLKLKDNGTAQLTVNVPGPGALEVAGNGVAPRQLARRSVAAAGPATVLIRARGKARGKLNRKGKVRLNATITYTASGGVATPSVQQKKVKLRKR